MWDVKKGVLRDRFGLPPYCKGVRCLASPEPSSLVAGTTNGWVLHFDLRTGRWERKFAHAESVNTLAVQGPYLISAGDDKLIRISDARGGGGPSCSFAPLSSHRVRSVVFAAAADAEAVYIGSDASDVRVLDFSAAANPQTASDAGGFTTQQKAALASALEASRRPRPPGHMVVRQG